MIRLENKYLVIDKITCVAVGEIQGKYVIAVSILDKELPLFEYETEEERNKALNELLYKIESYYEQRRNLK